MTEVPVRQHLRLPLLADEMWWGGAVADGQLMPFGAAAAPPRPGAVGRHHRRSPRAGNNQSAPLLLSNRGRFIWSEQPFEFDIDRRHHRCRRRRAGPRPGRRPVCSDAYRTASAAFFPGVRQDPAPQMFRAPQYNTWIEMPYRPTQDGGSGIRRGICSTPASRPAC